MPTPERLVVVGNGMASLRFLERLDDYAPARFDVKVIGEEPAPAYNRVLLSALLAGDTDEASCRFRETVWYAEKGFRLVTGLRADRIDRQTRTVVAGTEIVPYDRLVLATGSTPIRLPVPGAGLDGVIAFRDLAHLQAMRAAVRPGAKAVVIGGGLLGLEAAYGLARIGIDTTLVHVMDRLMERQLDRRAAALVRQAIERRGVRVFLGANTAAYEGKRRVEAVRLQDGRSLPADIVVEAVGVRPRADLAQSAGLEVGRGVKVDDRMRTSDDAIFAVGECSEHRGQVYGLVEPGYEQADVLARHMAGQDARYEGSVLATNLKVSGLPVFSAGAIADDAAGEPIVLSDPVRGIYRKLLIQDGRLAGAVMVGNVAEGRWYLDLIATGEPVGGFRQELMFGRAAPDEPAEALAA